MKILKLFLSKRTNPNNNAENIIEDPFNEIAELIKRSRIEQNLSMRDLSDISKIPLSTIKSFENNIRETRPKYPFTRSILLKLEECLFLKKYQLINLAKKEQLYIKKKKYKNKNFVVNKFELLESWHGNIIYLLVLIISIFVLNNYFMRTRVIEFRFIEKNTQDSLGNSN